MAHTHINTMTQMTKYIYTVYTWVVEVTGYGVYRPTERRRRSAYTLLTGYH